MEVAIVQRRRQVRIYICIQDKSSFVDASVPLHVNSFRFTRVCFSLGEAYFRSSNNSQAGKIYGRAQSLPSPTNVTMHLSGIGLSRG